MKKAVGANRSVKGDERASDVVMLRKTMEMMSLRLIRFWMAGLDPDERLRSGVELLSDTCDDC
jgi:hypothetical protein